MKSRIYYSILLMILIGAASLVTSQLFSQSPDFNSGSVIQRRILRGQVQEAQVVNARGTLQWQQSPDGINWQNWAGKTSSSVAVTADVIVFFRCSIKEANCDPVYSDVMKIIPFDTPTVTTTAISAITAVSASSGGTVVSEGGLTVNGRGVCWSIKTNPTIADSKTADGNGPGSFTSNITGLTGNTIYYVRAYATNAAGTSYGNEVSFRTITMLPIVTTAPITSITQTTALGGGNVITDGGASLTARGICWSRSQNPTIANYRTVDGASIGNFVSILGSLSPNTTYYVRAYATNSLGISYGDEVSFITSTGL